MFSWIFNANYQGADRGWFRRQDMSRHKHGIHVG